MQNNSYCSVIEKAKRGIQGYFSEYNYYYRKLYVKVKRGWFYSICYGNVEVFTLGKPVIVKCLFHSFI